ncbi:hydroxysteroid dehydrogenase 1 [Artemisia annua]|uniref:Hydroxysteroid dehydrogenase 1 n=1 Tax=Artemisia annua TaxID=35608 RepID=A0A2U1MDX6_ARTAN|nr:hydroxysteroid dehydrogenase 1 [Artemisia annua]PWA59473.1 hydroxysteroid dehydrogenase 1 [Artemisia annua]
MDLVNGMLNLVAPPFTFFTMLMFLPPWMIFKFFLGILRTVFPENVAGKVVLITGASSGIGEHLAYEYASRGACLALSARRDDRLREVADRCRQIGAPDVIIIHADVSSAHDCKRMVDQTVHHFNRLDHLVNNAGISQVCMLEDADDITNLRPVMDINFWGSVYTTKFAAPHLRNCGGRLIVLSSAASWLPVPRMSIYNASKAALAQFYETMRVEFGSDIKITLVTPGYIESELTQGKFLSHEGRTIIDPDARDMQVNLNPVEKVGSCARAIVKQALRGERYVTEPSWMKMSYVWKVLWPEAVEWVNHLMCMTTVGGDSLQDTFGKKVMDIAGAKNILYPASIQSETKTE